MAVTKNIYLMFKLSNIWCMASAAQLMQEAGLDKSQVQAIVRPEILIVVPSVSQCAIWNVLCGCT
jgi:hypothetical protein